MKVFISSVITGFEAFRNAASTAQLKGVMDVLEGEWSSARIVGDPHSSIVDLPLTMVQSSNFLSVAAWYDNEYGYANQLIREAVSVLGGKPRPPQP